MRLQKDIIGKEVLNAKGKILGNVKDIEIDNSTIKITFLVISTTTKKSGFSLTKGNDSQEEKIPIAELGSVGDKIILKETLDDIINKI